RAQVTYPPPIYAYYSITETSPTTTYPLSLHDALPISTETLRSALPPRVSLVLLGASAQPAVARAIAEIDADALVDLIGMHANQIDRKSTRLNSSHRTISYAVFCLKKKKVLL